MNDTQTQTTATHYTAKTSSHQAISKKFSPSTVILCRNAIEIKNCGFMP
jgi:hypothetical protein